MSEHVRTSKHTARKRLKHQCFACDLPILPKDTYFASVHSDVDRIYTCYQHEWCTEEIDAIIPEWDEYSPGILADEPEYASEKWQRWYAARKAILKESDR